MSSDLESLCQTLAADGFVMVPGALDAVTVARLAGALDRVYAQELASGRLGDGELMHVLGHLDRDEGFLELLDHPTVFPLICHELGWNIHVYHCHLDVTPPAPVPAAPGAAREAVPARWGWHQDGGRQNLELETEPRPRMSLKVAYWLSDLRAAGRGNMLVIPSSHQRNTLPRPPRGPDRPAGAMPVLASAGDALVFDRRLWHSRSANLSGIARKAIFLAYTYRWVRPRDVICESAPARLSPLRRQLIGHGEAESSFWGRDRDAVPLHAELSRLGVLDTAIAQHR